MFLRFGAKKVIAKCAGAKSAEAKKAIRKQPRLKGCAKTYPTLWKRSALRRFFRGVRKRHHLLAMASSLNVLNKLLIL